MRLLIVKVIAVMFLIGGCARLLSIAMVGVPHPFFLVLLGIELIAPAIILVWTQTPAFNRVSISTQ